MLLKFELNFFDIVLFTFVSGGDISYACDTKSQIFICAFFFLYFVLYFNKYPYSYFLFIIFCFCVCSCKCVCICVCVLSISNLLEDFNWIVILSQIIKSMTRSLSPFLSVCVMLYIYIYMYIYICIYIYIYSMHIYFKYSLLYCMLFSIYSLLMLFLLHNIILWKFLSIIRQIYIHKYYKTIRT